MPIGSVVDHLAAGQLLGRHDTYLRQSAKAVGGTHVLFSSVRKI